MGALTVMVLLADLVAVFPGRSVVPLPGAEGTVEILVRNVSPVALREVRLEAESGHCAFRVEPAVLPLIRPSDRASFRLVLLRTAETRARRFPLQLRLSSRHHELLRAFQLIGDGRAGSDGGKGWIDVGVVKIGSGKRPARTLLFWLLGFVPLALLLGLGLVLKRRARRGGSGS